MILNSYFIRNPFLRQKKLSLAGSIYAVVITLALTALVTLGSSGWFFHSYVKDIEKQAVLERMQLKVKDLHLELSQIGAELAINLQNEPGIREAIRQKNFQAAVPYLDDHFDQYYVAASVIALKKIYLFDTHFNYLAQSSEGLPNVDIHTPLCPHVTQQAQQRKGTERLRTLYGLCRHENRSLLGVVVPVRTLNPIGYLMVVLDPSFNVPQLSKSLEMPVRTINISNEITYTSPDWKLGPNIMEVRLAVKNSQDQHIYTFSVADDTTAFNEVITSTTERLMSIAGLIILGASLFFFTVLRGNLSSLNTISIAALRAGQGHFQHIEKSGYVELDNVVESYNQMVTQVEESQLQLEKKIEDATIQLIDAMDALEKRNSELETAIALANQASNAKDAFLSKMSHELRTPLNSVIGYSDIILHDTTRPVDTQTLDEIKTINESGLHLLKIVDDVLHLTKMEAGKVQLELSDFDLNETVKSVIHKLQSAANKNQNTIDFTTTEIPALINSDEKRLQQILCNLLDNAIKYTQNGHIDVSVRLAHSGSICYYLIAIKDNGIGIKEDKIEQLFEAFQQADNSNTRAYDGTGLGLKLAREIIHSLNGRILIDTEYGKGSTFTLEMPIRY
jgi:signal transduction histidine kinase